MQDDFRLSQKLTLNLGLRWDMFVPWVEIDDRQSNRSSTGKFVLASDDTVIDGVNVGRPADLFEDRPDRAWAWPMISTAAAAPSSAAGDVLELHARWHLVVQGAESAVPAGHDADDQPGANLKLSEGLPPAPGVDPNRPPAGTTRSIFDINARDGYAHNYNVNVQRQMGTNYLVEVAYAGSRGRQLTLKDDPNRRSHPRCDQCGHQSAGHSCLTGAARSAASPRQGKLTTTRSSSSSIAGSRTAFRSRTHAPWPRPKT